MVITKPPEANSTGSNVLTRILHEAWEFKQSSRPFLTIFDLDSTLFDLTLRFATIVDEFVTNPVHIATFPHECESLKKVEIRTRDWGLEEPFKRAGLSTNSEFFKSLHRHWVERFFSNEYLIHDEPLPGSVEYVQELAQVGADIMYLTGRDIPRMLAGTEKSLRETHFPIDTENVKVVLKPRAELDDAQFKLDVIREAEEKYERIWLFENEPVNLNLVARHLPEVGLVFIDSTHSGREQISASLDTIRHYETNLSEFRALRVPGSRRG